MNEERERNSLPDEMASLRNEMKALSTANATLRKELEEVKRVLSEASRQAGIIEAERDRLKAENEKLETALRGLLEPDAAEPMLSEEGECAYCLQDYTDEKTCDHLPTCAWLLAKQALAISERGNKVSKPWPPEIEAEIDRTYKLGQAVGLEEASKEVMQEASALFLMGRFDEQAKTMRTLSHRLLNMAQKRHPNKEPK